jgi:hypothetical protein
VSRILMSVVVPEVKTEEENIPAVAVVATNP